MLVSRCLETGCEAIPKTYKPCSDRVGQSIPGIICSAKAAAVSTKLPGQEVLPMGLPGNGILRSETIPVSRRSDDPIQNWSTIPCQNTLQHNWKRADHVGRRVGARQSVVAESNTAYASCTEFHGSGFVAARLSACGADGLRDLPSEGLAAGTGLRNGLRSGHEVLGDGVRMIANSCAGTAAPRPEQVLPSAGRKRDLIACYTPGFARSSTVRPVPGQMSGSA